MRGRILFFVMAASPALLSLTSSCGSGAHPAPEIGGLAAAAEDRDVKAMLRDLAGRARAAPDQSEPWLVLGMALEANGMTPDAAAVYAHAAALEPGSAKAWYRLAQVRMELDDTAQASAAFDRAARADAGYAPIQWRHGYLALKLGQLDVAEQEFRAALAIDKSAAAATVGLARVQLQREDAATAAATLEAFLEKTPRDAYARQLLGSAYRDLGRAADARREFERGATAPPSWSDAWNSELNMYKVGFRDRIAAAAQALEHGKPQIAVPILEGLLAKRPGNLTVIVNLAGSYLALNRTDDAVMMLEDAEKKHPEREDVQLQLARAYRQQRVYYRAMSAAQKALALKPGDESALQLYKQIMTEMSR